MTASDRHVFPILDQVVKKFTREKLLKQKALTFWFTGLSGAGKSTIAIEVEKRLTAEGRLVYVLDGDNIRTGLNRDLGFSESDRSENIRRVAEVNRILNDAGVITLNCFVSPMRAMRDSVREIVGKENLREIFVNAPLEVVEARDTKGLYKKARAGEIQNLTGVNAPFEPPLSPDLEVKTDIHSIPQSVEMVFHYIVSHITLAAS